MKTIEEFTKESVIYTYVYSKVCTFFMLYLPKTTNISLKFAFDI